MRLLVLIISFSFFTLPVLALDDLFFRSLRSENIFVYDYLDGLEHNRSLSDLPDWIRKVRSTKVMWTPTFEFSQKADCSPIINLPNSPTPIETEAFMRRCQKNTTRNSNHVITHIFKMLTLDYPTIESQQGRTIVFNLKNGIKVRGQLFLKGAIQRPLIVVRTGVFSSLNTMVPERFLPMSLFDEGPFHVLILTSTTGSDFISDNSEYIFGGIEEGIQTLEIIRSISQPSEPLSKYITKISTVGVSLGGHGVLWANLLASAQETPLISKSLLLCPVVDLKTAERYLLSNPIKSTLIGLWAEKRMSPLIEKYGELSNIKSEKGFMISSLLKYFETKYKEPLVGWPIEIKQNEIPVEKNFEDLNDFNNWWKTPNKIPTLVINTDFDPLVNPKSTTDINKSPLLQSPLVRTVQLNSGVHCSLPTAYNWQFISETLRTYFNEKEIPQEVSWSQTFASDFAKKIEGSNFKVEDIFIDKGEELFQLELSLSKKSFWCKTIMKGYSRQCKRESFVVHIPISAIDFSYNLNDETFKPILLRWLNSHLQIRENPDGFKLVLFRPARSE